MEKFLKSASITLFSTFFISMIFTMGVYSANKPTAIEFMDFIFLTSLAGMALLAVAITVYTLTKREYRNRSKSIN